jgi:hypothetical protein
MLSCQLYLVPYRIPVMPYNLVSCYHKTAEFVKEKERPELRFPTLNFVCVVVRACVRVYVFVCFIQTIRILSRVTNMQYEIVISFEYNTINSANRTIFTQQIVH